MARLIVLLVLLLAGPLQAQQDLEIILLRSQTVDRVLPVLQPLVEPGGSLVGMNNQLFLRASPRNRQEIKRVLATIDTPSRRLVIHVSQRRDGDEAEQGGRVSGSVVLGSTRQGSVGASVWDTRSTRSDQGGQVVQTIDGGQAFIQVGTSIPIPLRQITVGPGGAVVSDSVVYRDIGQGFYAEPHVNGDRVSLEISQQAETSGRYGTVGVQRLSTTVSGRLGEWIELGGSGRGGSVTERGGITLSTTEIRDRRSIWLKVEEVK